MVVNFGDESNRVALSIAGYELDTATDRYDKNWLQVKIGGYGDRARKQVQSAALLTWELRKLRSFIAVGIDGDSLDFMEPDLEFRCDNGVISVELRYGLRLCSTHKVETYSQMLSETWKVQALKTLDDLCGKYPIR